MASTIATQYDKKRHEANPAAPLSLAAALSFAAAQATREAVPGMPMFQVMPVSARTSGALKAAVCGAKPFGGGIGDDLGAFLPSSHRVNVQTWLLSLSGGRSG